MCAADVIAVVLDAAAEREGGERPITMVIGRDSLRSPVGIRFARPLGGKEAFLSLVWRGITPVGDRASDPVWKKMVGVYRALHDLYSDPSNGEMYTIL